MVSCRASVHAVPMTHLPRVLVLIGPSGTGKSSVVRELHRRGAALVRPTWTTRPPRRDELDGSLEHRFVSDPEFDVLDRDGFFCQTGSIAGIAHRYGLPKFEPRGTGPVDTVILRAAHVEQFCRLVPGTIVYQIEDRSDRVAERVRARGCPSAETVARLRDNITESDAGRRIAQRTFVNDGTLDQLVDAVIGAMGFDVPAGRRATLAGVAR
jgi:guanylate kinase